jgi:RHS repeat-associated protein
MQAVLCRVVFVLIILYFPCAACAQLTTAEERGLPSNSSFQSGDVDTVNLQNGNLHINIPLVSSKQRGGTVLSWSLVFDTQTWIKQAYKYVYPNCAPSSDTTPLATSGSPDFTSGGGGGGTCAPPYYFLGTPELSVASGWRVASPFTWHVGSAWIAGATPPITCPTNSQDTYQPINNWTVEEPNGTQHPLAIYEEMDLEGNCNPQTLQGPTTDGSGMYFNTQTGVLVLKNGVQIQMTAAGTGQFTGGTMVDSNGNEAGPNDTLNRALVTTTNGPTTTYTSPLGATAEGPSYTTYAVLDSNGNTQKYTVNYELVDLNPDICSQNPPTGTSIYDCNLGSFGFPLVISEVVLPDGLSYKFTYYNNSQGEIQQVTLPTGATIGYTYADDYQLKFVTTGVPDSVVGARGVATRTVTVNGSAQTWTYDVNMETWQTKVTDPLGNVALHTFGTLCANSCTATSADVYEATVQYYGPTNNLLRTVTNSYDADYDPVNNIVSDGRLVSQITKLENGQQSQRQIAYDSFTYSCNSTGCPGTGTRMKPVEVQDYDFGASSPGSLLRTTDTSYDSFSIGGWTITKPQAVTVYDASGNQASQTTYEYDNYAHTNQPMVASGAVQHSASFGTGYTTRGNITAVSRWRNTDGAMLTSTNQYDDAGNLLSTIDPMGDTTTFSYSDSWSNTSCAPTVQSKAYLTKTTNANGKTTTSTYNSCTGTVAATTDSNSKTTTTTYDLINRPSQNNYPDGGQTNYCYSDVEGSACYNASVESVTATDKISSTINYIDKTVYDGLGRAIQTQLTSDPEGVVYTDTIYDEDGRVSQISNPYRSGDTEYYTTNTYDGLGRVTKVTKPDNSYSTTVYTGNTTLITDEAGNNRKSVTDAIGRLTTVYENPTGLNYETDYIYDILGDLLQVTQKGGSTSSANWRTRTFSYNSLGQLLCSANPEIGSPLASVAACPNPDSGSYTAGTIRYGYDNDGNLTSKIAPLADQQGTSTVTTSYTYDSLHRLTQESYTDGTPTVTTYYDGATPTACTPPTLSATNVIDRPSAMCDGSGATAWSYDSMGRPLTEARKIGSYTNQTGYTYYLDGNTNTISYPLAGGSAYTVTYAVNAAGRTTSVSDSNGDIHATVNSTWAFGAPKSYQYGTNIVFSNTYNARLQPLTLTATQTSPSNTLFSKTYNFHAGSGSTQGTDNGNLYGVTDGLDSLGLNRPNGSVNYTYDAMNRVTSAKTLGTACTAVAGGTLNWGESFTIDAWGNLTAKTPTLCSAEQLSSTASARNQLAAATYDSAGNAIANNGLNYTYDAEGRITSASGTSYIYDGASERVAKTGTLYWKGTGSEALVESSATNTNPTRYIFFNGKRIARIDPGATTAKYYVQDNVGSTALVTDYLGNPLSESLFFPYGGEQAILTNDSNTYKFTGKQRDPETGLDDFGARYYASNLGRFMSPDWAAKPVTVPYATFGDPQTLNLYSYVENGPLNRVDADGHAANKSGIENNWLGFDEGPCAGTWSITCIEQTHADNIGSLNLSDETADEQAYDAMVQASQQGVSQSQSNASNSTSTAQQQTGRQPDGSYVAPTGPGSEIYNRTHGGKDDQVLHPPDDTKGQCVTACKYFSGITAPTTAWKEGPAVSGNSSIPIGTAIATFGPNGKYPTNGDQNSGIYMGQGKNGSILILDQWPAYGPPLNTPAHPPQIRTMQLNDSYGHSLSNSASAYHVIIVP